MIKPKNQDLLLKLLRDAKPKSVSIEILSASLKITKSSTLAEIRLLRKLGYKIVARPTNYFTLVKIPDKMFADEISYQLNTKIIGREICSYEETQSTNAVAFDLGERNLKEGVVVIAEYQSAGRGRLGRSWQSPRGKNMLLSILLRPTIEPADIPKITLMTAVSISKTIRKLFDIQTKIKWPNDILYQEKKLCGILTQMSSQSSQVEFVVVGIGVNLNDDLTSLPHNATSLGVILGKKIDRVEFAREFLKQFERDYLRFKSGFFEELAKEWEESSDTVGRFVTISALGRKIHGQAQSIDQTGALWIRKENGLKERVSAGDVEHLR